ncbi:MAG: NRDE family protein [Saonia sp.]
MCTVSFLSSHDQFFITSNRDERTSRSASFEPVEETINNGKIIYPKDPKAGGTWFAINDNGQVCVLLNGAFEKHIPNKSYSRSRGLVLLDIIRASSPSFQLETIDLNTIEPFTLIVYENRRLLEFRWDGDQKYTKELDINKQYIWSSATLYSKEVMSIREALFAEFLTQNNTIIASDIVDFHSNNHNDYENGFVINREDSLKTLSITQAIIAKDEIGLNHMDLLQNKEYFISVATDHVSNQS